MKFTRLTQFDSWLKQLGKAWVETTPEILGKICAPEVKYYETPFGKPYIGPEAVVKLWQNDVPNSQKDIKFKYDIVSFSMTVNIAHWSAEYTRIKDNQKVILDGIFQVALNKEGLCTEFHMWWVVK